MSPTYSLPPDDFHLSTFNFDTTGDTISIAIPVAAKWTRAYQTAIGQGGDVKDDPKSIKYGHGVEAYNAWLHKLSTPEQTCYYKLHPEKRTQTGK
ncbi:hypothetical protein FRB95_003590 [Tulasnella sp. JGI-2019a]|nr:hypothetical protein FRB93_000417 [Tulasnella sp. JGI-2019a]KAG9030744.1 hypothetical protein FRB95_003590 [Tulasnella sp. JGI-2019a]